MFRVKSRSYAAKLFYKVTLQLMRLMSLLG